MKRYALLIFGVLMASASYADSIVVGSSGKVALDTTVGELSVDGVWHKDSTLALRISTCWDGAESGVLMVNGTEFATLSAEDETNFQLMLSANTECRYDCVWKAGETQYARTLVTKGARRKGMSASVTLDTQKLTRIADSEGETLPYSTKWESESGAALAIIKAGGEVVNSAQGSGEFHWVPQSNGVYTLTHQVELNGALVGEVLSTTFAVEHFPAGPTISPEDGTTFTDNLTVSIEKVDGATIYYTLDGTTPTTESLIYSTKFPIFGKTIVKAIAITDKGLKSDVSVANYALGACAEPVIYPASGTTFDHGGFEVTIEGGTGGVLRYTLDGSEPNNESAVYTGAFTIDDTTTIKAKVFSDNFFDSQVVTAVYERKWVQVPTPVIDANETFVGVRTEARLTCTMTDATIYYTLDGSTPTTASLIYEGSLLITNTCTIKAFAVNYDYLDSKVAIMTIGRQHGIGDVLNMPYWKFNTYGDGEWLEDKAISHDGVASMRSGEIDDSESVSLETTVSGKGTLSFWWKASCEDAGGYFDYDHGEFKVDGTVVAKIDGETNWTQVTYVVEEDGEHRLTWTYLKDGEEAEGSDCVWVDEVAWKAVNPLPDLGQTPTVEQVAGALYGVKDARVSDRIIYGTDYKQFREWAGALEGATSRDVFDSPYAWLSFGLDTPSLIAKEPTNGDLKIEGFEATDEEGVFNFTVGLTDIVVGDGATEANLKRIFGLKGGQKLGELSAENVDITFGTPQDGKVKFTAGPKDAQQTPFFMKVKMTP